MSSTTFQKENYFTFGDWKIEWLLLFKMGNKHCKQELPGNDAFKFYGTHIPSDKKIIFYGEPEFVSFNRIIFIWCLMFLSFYSLLTTRVGKTALIKQIVENQFTEEHTPSESESYQWNDYQVWYTFFSTIFLLESLCLCLL